KSTTIGNVILSYDAEKNYWYGKYQIPKALHGLYGVEVTAIHGAQSAKDEAFGHWVNFYLNYLSSAIQKWKDFKIDQLVPFIQYVNGSLHNLSTTFQTYGGLKGVVKNLTLLPEWHALLQACALSGGYYSEYFSQSFSENATFEYSFVMPPLGVVSIEIEVSASPAALPGTSVIINITDARGESFLYPVEMLYPGETHTMLDYFFSPPTGIWRVNVTTSYGPGAFNISFSGIMKYDFHNLGAFLQALTNFILSSEYDNLTSTKPELRSLFENVTQLALALKPLQLINYLAEYNFTNILSKIEGSENIVAAYQALFNSIEYLNFLNALDSLKAGLSKENLEAVILLLQELAESDYFQELLNSTAQYLQGNQTALQCLIQSWLALRGYDLGAQFSALQNLPEYQNLIDAILATQSLSEVYNQTNSTYHGIKAKKEQMLNSTEFVALTKSIQDISEYMRMEDVWMGGYFSGSQYYERNFTVKDWCEKLKIEVSPSIRYWYYYTQTVGELNVTLTDPNGVKYSYMYNLTALMWETDSKFIYFPTPGVWHVNVSTGPAYGYGSFSLTIAPAQEFQEYMLLETLDKLFLVLNAGVAIETEPFAQIGTNATAKLIAYDVDGKLANTTINLSVARKHPFYGSPWAAAVLYTWMTAFKPIEKPPEEVFTTPSASAVCSYSDGNYTVTIADISRTVSIREVRLVLLKDYVVKEDKLLSEVYEGMFKDANADGYLSAGDYFIISGDYDRLRLVYVPTNETLCEISLPLFVKAKTPNEAPVAIASVPSPMLAGVSYTFDASSSYDPDGYIVEYYWDFGDGSSGYGEYIEHTYLQQGKYVVTLRVTDNESAVNTTTIIVTVVEAPPVEEIIVPELKVYPSLGLLQFLAMMSMQKTKTVYKATVTTDAKGEATITFPVEEYCMYSIYAWIKTDTKLGFGAANVFGEYYVPEINLVKLGEFSGIPVYKSPNKIGENITLSVDVPQEAQVAAFVMPLPFKERYPEINVTYEPSFNFTNVTGNLSLQVNGPVSIIGLVSGNLSGMLPQPEYKPPTYTFAASLESTEGTNVTFRIAAVSPSPIPWSEIAWQLVNVNTGDVILGECSHLDYDDDRRLSVNDCVKVNTGAPGNYKLRAIVRGEVIWECAPFVIGGKTASNDYPPITTGIVPMMPERPPIPQINISYGILLASDVDVTLTIPTLVKGGVSTIYLSAQGTIGNTSGLAFYANGNDFTAFDLNLLSKIIYRYGILKKEPSSPAEVLELLSKTTGIVWGSGNTACVKLPTLCAYGDYSIVTVSAVDSQFGVGFAQAGFYRSLVEAQPTTTIHTLTVQTVAGKTVTVNLPVSCRCTAPVNVKSLTIAEIPEPSKKVPAGKKVVGFILQLDTTGDFQDAFITIPYTDEDIAGVDENSLRMYYWNETTSEWELVPESDVWTGNNTVWARITHLTIFAPLGEEMKAAPAIPWLIWTGVLAAFIIIMAVALAVVARKRRKIG
ncbi:MAG: PKD domain-containing protein, partial [Candidatus Thermoplasmatota archaeon]